MATFLDDPVQSGLLQFGLAMMAGAGPSPHKQSLGSIVGKAGLVGTKAYKDQQEFIDEMEQRKFRRKLLDMQTQKIEQDVLNEQQADKWVSDPNNFFKTITQRTEAPIPDGMTGPGDLVETQSKVPLGQNELLMSMLRGPKPIARDAARALLTPESSKPLVVGNYVLSPDGKTVLFAPPGKGTDEKDAFLRRMEAAGIDRNSPEGQNLLRAWLAKESTRAPNEQIAIKIEGQRDARGRVSENLNQLLDAYKALEVAGGAIKTGANPVENVTNYAMSTVPGQMVGKALGTQTQQARNRIEQLRPLLIQEIRQATQMGAKGLDSNAELQFYLQAATDTTKDIDSNLAAIEVLDRAYGLGLGIASKSSSRDALKKEFGKTGQPGNPIAPQGGLKRGDMRGGYMYLGGDPNNEDSWAKTP